MFREIFGEQFGDGRRARCAEYLSRLPRFREPFQIIEVAFADVVAYADDKIRRMSQVGLAELTPSCLTTMMAHEGEGYL